MYDITLPLKYIRLHAQLFMASKPLNDGNECHVMVRTLNILLF